MAAIKSIRRLQAAQENESTKKMEVVSKLCLGLGGTTLCNLNQVAPYLRPMLKFHLVIFYIAIEKHDH
jgi:hypothetical protein